MTTTLRKTVGLLGLLAFLTTASYGQQDLEITFQVNMGPNMLKLGGFDDATELVQVAGSFNGWGSTTDTLFQQTLINDSLYAAVVPVGMVSTGDTLEYQFVIRDRTTGDVSWDEPGNRRYFVTGAETDTDSNGIADAVLDIQFYANEAYSDLALFTQDATVTVEVDARPAYYFLMDNGFIPPDIQTGTDSLFAITNIYANGPWPNPSGWEDWGSGLAARADLRLVDDGTTQGDAAAGDSIFTFQVSKLTGESRKGAFKMSVDGFDNETGFGQNRIALIPDGAAPTVRYIFGLVRQEDGTLSDEFGPGTNFEFAWDTYIDTNNNADPPTAVVVRSGGEVDTDEAPFDLEITFQVNMGPNMLKLGGFDDATELVQVAGSFNGWGSTTDTLFQQTLINDSLYAAVLPVGMVSTGDTLEYQFVTRDRTTGDISWDEPGNRQYFVTGAETDTDSNGIADAVLDIQFYANEAYSDLALFTQDATVTVEIDARPAYYFLMDNGFIPPDIQTGTDSLLAITNIYANGPWPNPSGWEDWGSGLAARADLRLVDDGTTQGDATAGDSIFTFQVSKLTGESRKGAFKASVDGFDNETGFGQNRIALIPDGATPTVRFIFGLVRQEDGTLSDEFGPGTNFADAWDQYILTDNTTDPPTATVVRSGGVSEVSVEGIGGDIPDAITLGNNYPNPFSHRTTFEYAITKAQHVRVRVFNVLGQQVGTLVDDMQTADNYKVTFDATGLASGLYFYRLETDDKVVSKTMVLVK